MNEISKSAVFTDGYKEQLQAVSASVSSTLISLLNILPSYQIDDLKQRLRPLVLSSGLPGTFCFHITDITIENGEYLVHFNHPIDTESEFVKLRALPMDTKLSIMEQLESIL